MSNHLVRWNILFPFAMWHIWINRNHNVFNKTLKQVSSSKVIARTIELTYATNTLSGGNNSTNIINIKWNPPPRGTFKLNIDVSFNNLHHYGGIGGVIRDERGNWKIGFRHKLVGLNPTHMELLSLTKGVELAYQFRLMPLEI